MQPRFVPAVVPPERRTMPSWWLAASPAGVLVRAEGPPLEPLADDPAALGLDAGAAHFLGRLDGLDCFATPMPAALPAGHEVQGLRQLYGRVDDELWGVAGRAVQVVDWDETHRYCGRDGTPTELDGRERARSCPRCGLRVFPRLAPATITLVRRGREALLARGTRFPTGFFSTLAGFVEPGESLEQSVAREIAEEVGVAVTAIRYFGSQPWPFPHSLMIGFTARWAGGEIQVDGDEIAEAGWFAPEALPLVPPPLSIARRLIDAWIADPTAC